MAGEINPNKGNNKIPDDIKVTYHKRGKGEEISREEFYHRISVFMEENGFEINANYHVAGTNLKSRSPLDNNVTRGLVYHAEECFNQIDEDGSGTISISELNKAIGNGNHVANFAQYAYSIDKVPDNPTDGFAEYRERNKEILEECKRAQTPKNPSQMKEKNFGL